MDLCKKNIIKKAKNELGVTYSELGALIGLKGTTLSALATRTKGEISINITKSIELLLENIELKKEIKKIEDFKKSLEEIAESVKK